MLGRREIEATDSKYPFPLMPIMHGSDFSCYFLLFFFFSLHLFLFRAPWVVTADEGEGRRGANLRWERVEPGSEPGAHSRSLVSPGAPSEPGGRLRAAHPSGPCLCREPEGRFLSWQKKWDGEASGGKSWDAWCGV